MNGQKVGDCWPDMYQEGDDPLRISTGDMVDVNVKQPDELSFVDEDIRELFEGCCYVMGMPLMAQLIKELRLWRQARGLEVGIGRGRPTRQRRTAKEVLAKAAECWLD